MLSIFFILTISQVVLLFDISLLVLGGTPAEIYRELILRKIYNYSEVMDSDSDSDIPISDDSPLNGNPILPIGSASPLDDNVVNVFYLTPQINSTSSTVPHSSASSEFTQMVSIMAFFTIVMLAIGAWLLSRHCCFMHKSSRGRNTNNVSAAPTSTVLNPRPTPSSPQFNFLGVQVLRRLHNGRSTSVVSVDKPDDFPPTYEELFPDVVVTQSPPYANKNNISVTMTSSSDRHDANFNSAKPTL